MASPSRQLLAIWLVAVLLYGLIVFGLNGFNTTAWTTFGGLVCIATTLTLLARRG